MQIPDCRQPPINNSESGVIITPLPERQSDYKWANCLAAAITSIVVAVVAANTV